MSIKTLSAVLILAGAGAAERSAAQIPIGNNSVPVVVTETVTETVVKTNAIVYTQADAKLCRFDYTTGDWSFLVVLKDANGGNGRTALIEVTKAQIQMAMGRNWEGSTTKEYFDATLALAIDAACNSLRTPPRQDTDKRGGVYGQLLRILDRESAAKSATVTP